jgi:very-short-patch-repair endonuclease
MSNLKENASFLRKNMTRQEHIIWSIIRNRKFYGFRFLRQYIIGSYIVDFICRERKIIIEIDGGQHNTSEKIVYDEERTKYLEAKGYKIIRFWNCDIDNNIEGVYEELKKSFDIH